jgi:transcriptional regulator with XRE-family HTH domain
MPDPKDPERPQETSSFAEGLARALKVLRTARDLSRGDLAEGAGLSYSYLANIEKGRRSPSPQVLEALAGALGMPTSELIEQAETWQLPPHQAGELSERTQAVANRMRGPARDEMRLALSSPESSAGPGPHSARAGRGILNRLFGEAETPHESLPRSAPPIERQSSGRYDSAFEGAQTPLRHTAAAREPAPGYVPRELVREIHAGNCVAFVGAGFSGASQLPDWRTLLREIARRGSLAETTRSHVEERVETGSAHALEEAAQMLEDQIGRDRFVALARQLLGPATTTPAMEARLRWLHGIPFRTILTTNFDSLLRGETPGADTYRQALRPEEHRWWSLRYWGDARGAYTVKLHGDLEGELDRDQKTGVVLTRRDYRRRLYEDPAYETFLRAVMATTTVLYMGFSFEDAYLNELRSEILALIGQERESRPVAYAIANDVPEETRRHFRQHEGIELLSYDSRGGTDFGGFDDWLREIHGATNPLLRFARYLESKRILWVDPHPQNNAEAYDHLAQAARLAGTKRSSLDEVDSADAAIRALRRRKGDFDLVISHWGEDLAMSSDATPTSTAERLLTAMRIEDVRCPVVVFAGARGADERKRTALGLGAQDYCFTFEALYQTIERVLRPGHEAG